MRPSSMRTVSCWITMVSPLSWHQRKNCDPNRIDSGVIAMVRSRDWIPVAWLIKRPTSPLSYRQAVGLANFFGFLASVRRLRSSDRWQHGFRRQPVRRASRPLLPGVWHGLRRSHRRHVESSQALGLRLGCLTLHQSC